MSSHHADLGLQAAVLTVILTRCQDWSGYRGYRPLESAGASSDSGQQRLTTAVRGSQAAELHRDRPIIDLQVAATAVAAPSDEGGGNGSSLSSSGSTGTAAAAQLIRFRCAIAGSGRCSGSTP